MKAIALFSGGLDSCLALMLMHEQGVKMEALAFKTPFSPRGEALSEGAAAQVLAELEVPLSIEELDSGFLEMVAHPRHGRGRNMNPCIDCRILMLKKAKRRMQVSGAGFVVTGEVLGQRPLSQNSRALWLIERESGLAGLILRPLSARLLSPSIPEIKGIVDRMKLLAIHGRSRKEQLSLARQRGLKNLPTPAGGCLLTDPAYSRRVRDLLEHAGEIPAHAAAAIRFGRYIRLGGSAFLVVGRNQRDNAELEALKRPEDWRFAPLNCPGPVALGIGRFGEEELCEVCTIVARYCDPPDEGEVKIAVHSDQGAEERTVKVGTQNG